MNIKLENFHQHQILKLLFICIEKCPQTFETPCMYLKGEILHDAHVLEHSSFKCFQDGADNFFFCIVF